MKTKQVRETPTEDLLAQVKDAKRRILEAKVKKTAADVKSNPLKVRTLRREVARMLTIVRERELQEKKQP